MHHWAVTQSAETHTDILLLLDAHLFDSRPDFVCTAAQRDLLQQLEILHGELLPLLEQSQDLTQGGGTGVGQKELSAH